MTVLSLDESNKKELILLAKKLNIKGRSLMTKDQLLKKIKKVLSQSQEED